MTTPRKSMTKKIPLPYSQSFKWIYSLIKTAFIVSFLGYQFSDANDSPRFIGTLPETPLGYYTDKSKISCKHGLPESLRLRSGEKLPKCYSIKNDPPAKNQGPLGTCVSFTVTGCAEYLYPGKTFSEAEFTILAQTDPTSTNGCQGGLFLGKALSVAQEYGLVLDADFPSYEKYLEFVAKRNGIDPQKTDWKTQLGQKEDAFLCNIDDPNSTDNSYNQTIEALYSSLQTQNDPKQDYTEHKLTNLYYTEHKLTNLYVLHHVSQTTDTDSNSSIGSPGDANIQSIKNALLCDLPVAAAVNIYGNWETPDNSTISMPEPEEIEGQDSHAIVLTGFDSNEYEDEGYGVFKFRNSWGKNWGDEGYGYLPYAYVQKYATELVAIGTSNHTMSISDSKEE